MEKSGDISLERRAKKKGVQNNKETEKGELAKILKRATGSERNPKGFKIKTIVV